MKKNAIIYLCFDNINIGHKDKSNIKHCVGGFGYTYDIETPGKKKLARKVPTTTGYHVAPGNHSNVVKEEDIVQLLVTLSDNRIEAVMKSCQIILDTFNHEDYHNVGIILQEKILERLLKANRDKLASNDWKVNKVQIKEADYDALIASYKAFNDNGHKLLIDVNSSLEGGYGNQMAMSQSKLAIALTQWSNEPNSNVTLTPFKEFNNPETDFNKVVAGNRWYFSTGDSSIQHKLFNGMYPYLFGKVEPKKKYYGKLTPDVCYSLLLSKEPIGILDKLFDYVKRNINNPNDYLYAGVLDMIKNKEVARTIETLPDIKSKKDLIYPLQLSSREDPTVIEMINPPALSYKIYEFLEVLRNIALFYLEKDEHPKRHIRYYDITDKIYEFPVNGKGVVKMKIHPDFKQNTEIMSVVVEHPKAVKPVTLNLTVGLDMTTRNAFNSIEDPNVKVWVYADTHSDKAVFYGTIVETNDFIYIHNAGVSNMRVLNLSELGQSKK